MNEILVLNGLFPDQRGTARRGKITGYNGDGIPCRRYTCVKPELAKFKDKQFEAFDTQIEYAIKRVKGRVL